MEMLYHQKQQKDVSSIGKLIAVEILALNALDMGFEIYEYFTVEGYTNRKFIWVISLTIAIFLSVLIH